MIQFTEIFGYPWPVSLFNAIIIAAIVFFQKRNPISSMAWILVLILSPLFGGILFLIFGVGVETYARYRYRKKLEMNQNSVLAHQKELVGQQGEADRKFYELVKYFLNSGCVYCDKNRVRIFTDAEEKYENLLSDIKNAKETVNIIYFIIRNDTIGNRLIDLLLEKAEEGVTVRLMYDGLGSLLTPKRLFNRLRKAKNCYVKEFFPVRLFSMSKINHRNHRKIAVIDDKIAYLGGMNIGDEYMSRAKKRNLNWRDTHLRIEGSAVEYVKRCFAQDWVFSTGEEIPIKPYSGEAPGEVPMQIVASGPDTSREDIKCGMIRMLYGAKRYVYIQSPYFVPDDAFLNAVRVAAQSGVDVRLMIPGVPDKKYVYHTTMSYVGELLDAGVRVFLYPGFIHAKTIVADDEIVTVGSANTDIRSFSLLFEINSFMYSSDTAKECRQIFENDQSLCHELTEEEYKKRGLIKTLKEGFFRLFSPIM